MYNKIKSVIENYNKQGKIADRQFVKTIISTVRDHQKLHDYILKLNYFKGNYKQGDIIQYDIPNKQIDIDLPLLIDAIELNDNFIIKSLYKNDKNLFINLKITFYLLHELEHASQIKNYNEINKAYIENILFHISNSFFPNIQDYNKGIKKRYNKYINKYQNLYYKSISFHDITPIERMANIKALKDVYAISKMIGADQYIVDYFKFSILNQECNNYIVNNECSLKTYLDIKEYIAYKCRIRVRDKSEREVLYINGLSDEYKLLYGLPVSNQEIIKKEKQMHNTLTYKRIHKAVTK